VAEVIGIFRGGSRRRLSKRELDLTLSVANVELLSFVRSTSHPDDGLLTIMARCEAAVSPRAQDSAPRPEVDNTKELRRIDPRSVAIVVSVIAAVILVFGVVTTATTAFATLGRWEPPPTVVHIAVWCRSIAVDASTICPR
jgi:hypothetical protein